MDQISPLEVGQAIIDAVKRKLDAVAADVDRLKKAEIEGQAQLAKSLHGLAPTTPSNAQVADGNPAKSKLTKSVFQILKKGETFIDTKHSADPKKRFKDVGFEGVVPGDKKEKEVSAEGSGGDIKKAGPDMGAKPPAAHQPPKPAAPAPMGAAAGAPPKAPKAPGASAMTVKKEVGVFAHLAKAKVK